MRTLAVILALIVGACTSTGQLIPAAQSILTVVCTMDKGAPAAVAAVGTVVSIVDPATVGAVALAAQADQIAHPVVQKACADALPGSVPAVVTPVPVAPVVPPTKT